MWPDWLDQMFENAEAMRREFGFAVTGTSPGKPPHRTVIWGYKRGESDLYVAERTPNGWGWRIIETRADWDVICEMAPPWPIPQGPEWA